MSIAFSKPVDPRALPEHTLWRMTKGTRVVEARTRMVPLGPELRIWLDGELLWSQVLRDGRDVGDLAAETRAAWCAKGWT